MKTIILLAAYFILTTIPAFSQKCITTADPFTAEEISSYDYHNKWIYYELKNGSVTLELTLALTGQVNIIAPKETEIFMKFENSEILKLVSVTEAIPAIHVSTGSGFTAVWTEYCYKFNLTKEDINILASAKLALLRYPDANGALWDLDSELRKKWIKVLLEGAQCMKSQLPKN